MPQLSEECFWDISHIAQLTKIKRILVHILIGLMLCTGLYFPTSLHGNISSPLSSAAEISNVAFCIFLLLLCDLGGVTAVVCSVLIPASLVLFTLLSPLPEFAFGAAPSFLAIALLFTLDLRSVGWSKWLSMFFGVINVVNLFIAVAIILNIQPMDNFLKTWHAAFYPELIGNMLSQNKPVLTFATHSIAGLMLFLFFYLNLKAYKTTRKKIYLVVSVGYLFACWRLSSVMGYFSSLLAMIYAAYIFLPKKRHQLGKLLVLVFPLLLVILAALSVLFYKPIVKKSLGVAEIVEQKLMSPTNGFLGRYSSEGVQGVNIRYIVSHPFQPAGFRTDGKLYFTDSGPVEYFLRGSLIMFVAMYLGLFSFLHFNLRSRASAYFLFGLLVLAELGFPYLKYFRFQGLLLFAVVFLNHLDKPSIEWF